jgi:hypothetical protein
MPLIVTPGPTSSSVVHICAAQFVDLALQGLETDFTEMDLAILFQFHTSAARSLNGMT